MTSAEDLEDANPLTLLECGDIDLLFSVDAGEKESLLNKPLVAKF